MGFLTSFLYSQLLVTLPKPNKDFSGQTVIITGSNTGLGREAARHLSALNASLIILAVRNTSKGAAAKESILASTGKPANTIEVWELDLDSYDSVKAFVLWANELKRLDAVLENAGIKTDYFKMVGGFEATITTNVISTFLLALMILPKLKETASRYNTQVHLSIVASDLHFVAKFPERNSPDIFDALNKKEGAELGMERYAVSKLLQVFAVRELGVRAKEDPSRPPQVIVNCLTPGACQSDFDRKSKGFAKLLHTILVFIFARTTEAGSRTLVAALEAGEESKGQYMADSAVADASPFVLSAEGEKVQKKVWTQLLQRLEAIQPGISQNIRS